MKIKITLFACEKEFSATADTIAEAYEYIKAAMKLNKNAFPDMSAEGQVSEVADQGSIRIAGDEHGPVGDYLYIAGGTDLRGGEYGGRRNENTERTGRAVGRFLKKQLPSSCCNHSDRRTDSSCRRYCVNTEY